MPDLFSPPIFLPLLAAVIYTLGSMLQKRAFHEGAGVRQVFHASNLTLAAVFLPFGFFEKSDIAWGLLGWPLLCAGTFYLGMIFTVLAIRRGDVSLVTPLLGMKVVMVAVGSVVLIGQRLPPGLWAGSVLAASGVFLMGGNAFFREAAGTDRRAVLLPVGLALASAACFAVTDVWLGGHAQAFGPLAFISVMFVAVAALSLLLNPLLLHGGDPAKKGLRTVPPGAKKWVYGGGLFIALQAACLGVALALYRDPTGANIVYSSRGLWAVAAAWLVPSLVGIPEFSRSRGGASLLAWRLSGTVLLTAGIVVAVLARSPGS